MTPEQIDETNRAAARLAAHFEPGGFPGFTIDDNTAWTSEQVKALLDHHRAFLRQTIEPDAYEVLRELDEARERNRKLVLAEVDANELRQRARTTNDLARQLADRTDELATLQQQFDDFRDNCSAHSADRDVEQIRLEDAEAALVRYGNEMARLAEAAKAYRAERDEARTIARHLRHIAFEGFDNGTSVFQQAGLDKLPDWIAATPDEDGAIQ